MDKETLRTHMLEARCRLSPREYRGLSARIRKRLWEVVPFIHAPLVLTYVSSRDNEVETLPVIERLLREGRPVAVPRVVRGRSMEWHRITGYQDLSPGRFGILEPSAGLAMVRDFPGDAVVLVPGIAFSVRGDRIGYGGGYFDRFLKNFPGVRIGLAFDLQIAGELPVETHDEPVDMVVTEGRVYRRT